MTEDLQSLRDEHTHLRVLAKKGVQTFRRLGRAFGIVAVDVPLTELSDEQVRTLRDEPRLRSQFVTLEQSESDESDAGDGDEQSTARARKPARAAKATKAPRASKAKAAEPNEPDESDAGDGNNDA